MAELRFAFKEWAVICWLLAEGRQAIILRKGGIAEQGDLFEPEHRRFWLYPTYLHQKADALTPEAAQFLQLAERERPAEGIVRLSHLAEVVGIYQLHDIVGPLRLMGLHGWSTETVEQRFRYRRPGLCVLAVRVFRATVAVELSETPTYAGCKSWVDLGCALPTIGAVPVLDDSAFRKVLADLEDRLQPTAFA